jgi:hypothetical protein
LTGYMEPPEEFEDGNNDTSTDNDEEQGYIN